jgi:hypothetical protein
MALYSSEQSVHALRHRSVSGFIELRLIPVVEPIVPSDRALRIPDFSGREPHVLKSNNRVIAGATYDITSETIPLGA